MIEVVLLCNLLALALNIPHLGHDRPSDPLLTRPTNVWFYPSVPGAHSDNNNCVLHIWHPIVGPDSLLVTFLCVPIRGPESLCVTFLAPNVGLKGLGWHG